jgi:hypothetical protein
MKKTALPPLPETSVFHPSNAKVDRDRTVLAASAFFDRLDAGGRNVRVITSSGTRTTRIRTRRSKKSVFS